MHSVNPPAAAPGRLRLAEEADLPIVREWARAYGCETNAHVDVTAFYERRVRRQSLFLWDDAGAKCMVAAANKTPNSVSISGVYTPHEFRNRGYASNAVAGATQLALDRGCKFCALFADRELVTPMRIYRSVGYRPLRDHLYIDLEPLTLLGGARCAGRCAFAVQSQCVTVRTEPAHAAAERAASRSRECHGLVTCSGHTSCTRRAFAL